MPMGNDPLQNHLIAALPAADFERLQAKLKLVPLPLGKVLYESGTRLRQVAPCSTCCFATRRP
jgi:hypothetical protein